MDGGKLAKCIRLFQILRLGRRQSGAFRCAGDGVSFMQRTGLRGRIPFLCRLIRRMAHKKCPLSASNAFRMTRQGDFMLIFKETSHKREAKKGSGDASPGLGGWGMNSPIAPLSRSDEEKEVGEAKQALTVG